jgi:predicted permease
MKKDQRLWRRFLQLGKPDVSRDVKDEVAFHLDHQIRDLMREGWTEEAARAEALRRFGDVQRVENSLRSIGHKRAREVRRVQYVSEIRQDVRFALRQLRKRPVFAGVTVLILGLGIGANAAVFGVVDAALVRALPFPESDELFYITDVQGGEDGYPASRPEFDDWHRDGEFFEAIAAVASNMMTLRQADGPEQVQLALTDGDVLGVHGLGPVIGRGFTAEELKGQHRVVMLSEGFWSSRFAKRSDVIGSTVTLNEESYSVIGVMPQEASVLMIRPNVVMWAPLPRLEWMDRGLHFLRVAARLKEGVSAPQARARLEAMQRGLQQADTTVHGVTMKDVREVLVGDSRKLLLVLFGSVVLVLAIVCANLANLFLSHSLGRSREFAVRVAIGAGRFRLARQVLSEALVLGMLGGIVGFGLARLIHGLVVAASQDAAILATQDTLDIRVMLFTLLISLGSAALFGLWPALRLTRLGAEGALREAGATRAFGSRAAWRRRRLLVGAEIALSVVLLAGAGLLVRSFARLVDVDPGFDPENVLTFQVVLPGTRYDEDSKLLAFHDRLLERLSGQPGVIAVGAVNDAPLTGSNTDGGFVIPGVQLPPDESPHANKRVVTPGYFEALRIPLLAGRTFQPTDRPGSGEVVIISESVARRYWPGIDPIGKPIQFSWGPGDEQQVIGVVGDIKHGGLDQAIAGEIYRPVSQFPFQGLTWVVRTRGEPSQIVRAARDVVRAIDPAQPIARVMTMQDLVGNSLSGRRTFMILLGGFAGVALVLAALGIYAVTAQSVLQRTREIGLRMAVGARRSDVLGMVLREELVVIVLGLALGLAGAFAATRVLRASLFEVSANDPVTFVAVAAILAVIAIVATVLPARRAARVDPIIALRSD